MEKTTKQELYYYIVALVPFLFIEVIKRVSGLEGVNSSYYGSGLYLLAVIGITSLLVRGFK